MIIDILNKTYESKYDLVNKQRLGELVFSKKNYKIIRNFNIIQDHKQGKRER